MTWTHLLVGGFIYVVAMAALFYALFIGADKDQPRADPDH